MASPHRLMTTRADEAHCGTRRHPRSDPCGDHRRCRHGRSHRRSRSRPARTRAGRTSAAGRAPASRQSRSLRGATTRSSSRPYPTYQYGVRVAVGDVNGDGKPEIVTAPAKGGWTEIRVFDGSRRDQIGAFAPFRGAGVVERRLRHDGRHERRRQGRDHRRPRRRPLHDGSRARRRRRGAETAGFWPYSTSTETGVRVAAADLNGDGKAEILTVPLDGTRVSGFGTGGGNPFRVYETFSGGAFGGATIAAGDVVGDRAPELVAAAAHLRGGAGQRDRHAHGRRRLLAPPVRRVADDDAADRRGRRGRRRARGHRSPRPVRRRRAG